MTSGPGTKNQHIEDDPFLMLSDAQWRYITARIDNPQFTIKATAEYLELSPQTVYHWPSYVNEALELARADMHKAALTVRKNALLKAMRVKAALLSSTDERIRDKAATDILEWELGKAKQPVGGTGQDGAFILRIEGIIGDD